MLTKSVKRWGTPILVIAAATVGWGFLGRADLAGPRSLSPYCMGTAPSKKISIEAEQRQFVPAEVHVAKGDCVELRISHAGGIAHNAFIEGTGISSEGAPLFDHYGHRYGRAMARMNPSLSPVMLEEGWFGQGEEVLLKFQAIKAGSYLLRCNVAESLGPPISGRADARAMVAAIVVSE